MDENEAKRDRVLKEAFECRVQLISYARAFLGDYAAADDAVQEAMLVVVKKFDQFREGTSMLAWCRSIVRLEVLRMKQKNQKERTLAQRLLDDAIDAAFDEFQIQQRRDEDESWRQALTQCLARVTERGRNVLRGRFVDRLSYQQIGEQSDMKLEAVRKTLFRLKKQVRGCVETRMGATQ